MWKIRKIDMGYYTNFSLEIEDSNEEIPQCLHKIPEGARFCPECGKPVGFFDAQYVVGKWAKEHPGPDGYNIDELLEEQWDSCKWCEHEKDMRALSLEFPKFLFILSGEGEESGDIWKEYYLNGKMQRSEAEIVIAPFDKSKLA
jgi:hypothetical protein